MVQIAGKYFLPHQDFLKSTIMKVFSTSNKMRGEGGATDEINKEMRGKLGKDVNTIIYEVNCELNSYQIYRESSITMRAKGLSIFCFTPYI